MTITPPMSVEDTQEPMTTMTADLEPVAAEAVQVTAATVTTTAAKRRWKILGRALKKQQQDLSWSKRSFSSYNLLKTTALKSDGEGTWYTVQLDITRLGQNNVVQQREHRDYDRCVNNSKCEDVKTSRNSAESLQNGAENGPCVNMRILKPSLSLHQLTGFNNTGNVCIWPSEECLAVYALKHKEIFADRRVLELGGGQTCLAGLAVAQACSPESVLLTDGNQESVNNLTKIVEQNPDLPLACQLYRWTDPVCEESKGGYDLILVADCLFFEAGRSGLVDHIYHLLARQAGTAGQTAMALVMAPQRSGTLDKFVALCENRFDVEQVEDFDCDVTRAHTVLLKESYYQPDIHQPRLLILQPKE